MLFLELLCLRHMETLALIFASKLSLSGLHTVCEDCTVIVSGNIIPIFYNNTVRCILYIPLNTPLAAHLSY